MNKPTYENVHNQFKLNGFHLDKEDLCRVAYSFIKEGEEFEKPVGNFLLDWFDSKSYVEMETSGTTGAPKRISVSKQAMVDSALATGDFFDLQPGNKALQCLPVKYVAGKMMLVRAMILGLDLEFVAPSSHPLENNEFNFDFVAMVPLQAQNSLAELKKIKKLIVGGAAVSKTLEKQLMKLSTEVYETYGMTETISHIAARKLGKKAFFIPTPGQFEQEYLAKRFKRNGLAPYSKQDDFEILDLKDVKLYQGLSHLNKEIHWKQLFILFEGE
jgi:O-succinylbenzoic acid--CoA ligase